MLGCGQAAHNVAVALYGSRVQFRQGGCMHGEKFTGLIQAVAAKAGVRDKGATGLMRRQKARGAAIGGNHALFYQLL